MKTDYDIEFEGKRRNKEEFVYCPWMEPPDKRMKYCSAFYTLWVRERDVKKGKARALIATPKNFNNAYRDFIDVVNRS